jgi:Tfp pilus assembly protein PilF
MGLLEQGQPSQAMVRFRVALAIDPSYVRAHYIMGQLLRVQRNWQAAADEYQAALRANPSDVRARVNLAGVLPALGRAREAYEHLDQAVRLDPNAVEALNNFAWLLATSADADLRDGGRAVQLGERACALTHFKQAAFIGTLAAAYAEAGNFPQAIATAQHAAEVATAAGDTALATRNQQLINLYRAGKPYRESSQRPQARQTPPRN